MTRLERELSCSQNLPLFPSRLVCQLQSHPRSAEDLLLSMTTAGHGATTGDPQCLTKSNAPDDVEDFNITPDPNISCAILAALVASFKTPNKFQLQACLQTAVLQRPVLSSIPICPTISCFQPVPAGQLMITTTPRSLNNHLPLHKHSSDRLRQSKQAFGSCRTSDLISDST